MEADRFMRKVVSMFFAFLLIFTLALPVQADSKEPAIYYNGNLVELEQPAFVENNKTYVPIRGYFQGLDYEVTFSKKNKTITVDYYGYESVINLVTGQVTEYDEVIVEKLNLITRHNTVYAPIRELEPIALVVVKFDSATQSIFVEDEFYFDESEYEEDYFEQFYNQNKKPSEGFLWKVQKDNKIVYLLGSIHVGDVNLYPLRDEINDAFDQSEVLVTEIDLSKEYGEELEDELVKLIYYTDKTLLKDHVSPATYAKIAKFANEVELDMDEVDVMQVWFINYLISTYYNSYGSQLDAFYGIDLHFTFKAYNKGIANWELESVMDQYKMLQGFSPALQEEMLVAELNAFYNDDEGNEDVFTEKELMQMWKDGNIAQLEQLVHETKSFSQEYYNGLVKNRNIGMVKKIEQYLNSDNEKVFFVIAGALHMVGPDGIVTLLEQQGYTVEKL